MMFTAVKEQWKADQRTPYEKARAEFYRLKESWEKECAEVFASSFIADRCKGPAGRSIIGMGKRALPFVMEEIGKGNILFNQAALEICGFQVAPGLMSEQDRSDRWIRWWQSSERDPEWNVFR